MFPGYTCILSGSNSNARKLNRDTITSSLVSMLLAVIVGLLLSSLLFSDTPFSGAYPRGEIDTDLAKLIPSLLWYGHIYQILFFYMNTIEIYYGFEYTE